MDADQAPTMTATEFKAKCLDVLDRLAAHEFERVTITKRGKVVGVLMPPDNLVQDTQSLFGTMRGRVIIPPGFDLTAPALEEPLDAEEGKLHR